MDRPQPVWATPTPNLQASYQWVRSRTFLKSSWYDTPPGVSPICEIASKYTGLTTPIINVVQRGPPIIHNGARQPRSHSQKPYGKYHPVWSHIAITMVMYKIYCVWVMTWSDYGYPLTQVGVCPPPHQPDLIGSGHLIWIIGTWWLSVSK